MRWQILGLLVFLLPGLSLAAPKSLSKHPIKIESQLLDLDRDKREAIFSDKVVVVQGNMVLRAKYMRVEFAKTTQKHSNDNIERIVMQENVQLERGGKLARANNGVYVVAEQKLYLDDAVRLTDTNDTLEGEHLVYDVKNDTANILRDEQTEKNAPRVRAVFTPKSS